jgi:hypothetical protein
MPAKPMSLPCAGQNLRYRIRCASYDIVCPIYDMVFYLRYGMSDRDDVVKYDIVRLEDTISYHDNVCLDVRYRTCTIFVRPDARYRSPTIYRYDTISYVQHTISFWQESRWTVIAVMHDAAGWAVSGMTRMKLELEMKLNSESVTCPVP